MPALCDPLLFPRTYISRYYNVIVGPTNVEGVLLAPAPKEQSRFVQKWEDLSIFISKHNQTYHTHTSCYY